MPSHRDLSFNSCTNQDWKQPLKECRLQVPTFTLVRQTGSQTKPYSKLKIKICSHWNMAINQEEVLHRRVRAWKTTKPRISATKFQSWVSSVPKMEEYDTIKRISTVKRRVSSVPSRHFRMKTSTTTEASSAELTQMNNWISLWMISIARAFRYHKSHPKHHQLCEVKSW